MWLWIVAALVAYYIKGLCGFANTLIFSTILGFAQNNVDISPVEIVITYPSNVIMAWKKRKFLNPRIFVPSTIFLLIGSIPGALMLKNLDARYIKIVFGVVIILLGLEMLLRESGRLRLKESKILMAIIGVASGILCGLFGIGALLAAYIGRVAQNSDEFKANINIVFVIENTIRIAFYSVIGIITFSTLKQSLLIIPFMLIGLFAGMKSSQLLNEKIVKRLVIVLLIISGIALIIKNIL